MAEEGLAELKVGEDKLNLRDVLTISIVKDVEKVGKKAIPKLNFKAKGTAGEFWYFTFKTSLFELIKEGAAIDSDIEISKREYENNIYVDRKVTQIYVDGQPVSVRQSRRYGGDSPEKIASIEAQKRADIIAQLWIAGVLEIYIGGGELKDKLVSWLKKLGEPLPKTTTDQDWEKMERPAAELASKQPPAKKTEPKETASVKQLQQIMKDNSWGMADLGKYFVNEAGIKVSYLKDLTGEQIADAIKYIKTNPKEK